MISTRFPRKIEQIVFSLAAYNIFSLCIKIVYVFFFREKLAICTWAPAKIQNRGTICNGLLCKTGIVGVNQQKFAQIMVPWIKFQNISSNRVLYWIGIGLRSLNLLCQDPILHDAAQSEPVWTILLMSIQHQYRSTCPPPPYHSRPNLETVQT